MHEPLAPEPADRAVARILAGALHGLDDLARVSVDLRRRDPALRVIARFEDCEDGRIPQITDLVNACDPHTRREVTATVAGLDERSRTLLLEPIWHSARSIA